MISSQRPLRSFLCLVRWNSLRSRKLSPRCYFSIASLSRSSTKPQIDASGCWRFSAPPPGDLGSTSPSQSSPSQPTSNASSDTTAPPPSVVTDDKSSSTFHDALKKQSGAQAQAQKPRPVFPWRHDILPIPRLEPGTKENEEAGRTFLSGYVAERTTAIWFLNVPFTTAFFRFSNWKQTMADHAAFAFAQGVAGILSNVSQLPLDSISVEDEDASPIVSFVWNDDDKKETDGNEPKSSINEKVAVDTTTESIDATKDETVSASDSPALSASEVAAEHLTEAIRETDTDVSNASAATLFPTNDESNGRKESTPETSSEASPPLTRHPAFQRPLVHKTYVDPSPPLPPPLTKTESPPPLVDTSTKAKDEPPEPAPDAESESNVALDVNEMMIEPLRKLFESAHQSGRDQLVIRLQTKPVEAAIYNLMCIPYVSREVALKNPERLQQTRRVKFGQEGMRTVLDNLEHDLDEKGKLETTVEMQVLISCLESFQVLDRETGVVLQGSTDGLLREVVHLVRFETTSVQEIKDGRAHNYYTNWKITDIDDMLGHVAWYQK